MHQTAGPQGRGPRHLALARVRARARARARALPFPGKPLLARCASCRRGVRLRVLDPIELIYNFFALERARARASEPERECVRVRESVIVSILKPDLHRDLVFSARSRTRAREPEQGEGLRV